MYLFCFVLFKQTYFINLAFSFISFHYLFYISPHLMYFCCFTSHLISSLLIISFTLYFYSCLVSCVFFLSFLNSFFFTLFLVSSSLHFTSLLLISSSFHPFTFPSCLNSSFPFTFCRLDPQASHFTDRQLQTALYLFCHVV